MNQNGVGPAILSLCSQRAVVEARSCFVPRVVPPLLSSRTLPVSEWPVRYKRKRRKKTCLPGFCASEFRSCVKVEVAWNHTEFGHNPKSCSEISTHRDSAVPKARCLPRPVRHAHTTHTHTHARTHTRPPPPLPSPSEQKRNVTMTKIRNTRVSGVRCHWFSFITFYCSRGPEQRLAQIGHLKLKLVGRSVCLSLCVTCLSHMFA